MSDESESDSRPSKRARDRYRGPGWPDDPRVEAVLLAARANLSVNKTAERARVAKSTLQGWLGDGPDGEPKYPEFVYEFGWIQASKTEELSDSAHEAAKSDGRLAFEMLKIRDPEGWKPVTRQETTGRDGGPVETRSDPREKEELVAAIRRAVLGGDDG